MFAFIFFFLLVLFNLNSLLQSHISNSDDKHCQEDSHTDHNEVNDICNMKIMSLFGLNFQKKVPDVQPCSKSMNQNYKDLFHYLREQLIS